MGRKLLEDEMNYIEANGLPFSGDETIYTTGKEEEYEEYMQQIDTSQVSIGTRVTLLIKDDLLDTEMEKVIEIGGDDTPFSVVNGTKERFKDVFFSYKRDYKTESKLGTQEKREQRGRYFGRQQRTNPTVYKTEKVYYSSYEDSPNKIPGRLALNSSFVQQILGKKKGEVTNCHDLLNTQITITDIGKARKAYKRIRK